MPRAFLVRKARASTPVQRPPWRTHPAACLIPDRHLCAARDEDEAGDNEQEINTNCVNIQETRKEDRKDIRLVQRNEEKDEEVVEIEEQEQDEDADEDEKEKKEKLESVAFSEVVPLCWTQIFQPLHPASFSPTSASCTDKASEPLTEPKDFQPFHPTDITSAKTSTESPSPATRDSQQFVTFFSPVNLSNSQQAADSIRSVSEVVRPSPKRLSPFTISAPGLSFPVSSSGGVLAGVKLNSVTCSPQSLNCDSSGMGDSPLGVTDFSALFSSSLQGPILDERHTSSSGAIYPFNISSSVLSPGIQGPYTSAPQSLFSYHPGIVRPVPASGLPWPIHPIPVRVPLALRPPSFGLCAVTSPDKVPSPEGGSVPDVPASPILGTVKPGLAPGVRTCGYFPGEVGIGAVDLNNNSSCNSGNQHCHTGSGREGGGKEILQGRSRNQNFKEFLQTAKVKLETINDGNGLKNPLLSPDNSHLVLDSGHLSFMTLDTFPCCPVCALKCDTPRLLQRHVRMHKEIKRYLCAWCGKGFNDTFDLKRHTRTHTGVRPYKCDYCGKAFTQRCSLESHCRKIHGETLPFTFNERRTKLYVCEDCGHSTPNIDLHFEHLRAQHPGHPALERPHHDRRQFKFCGDGGGGGSDDGDEGSSNSSVGEGVSVGGGGGGSRCEVKGCAKKEQQVCEKI